MAPAKPQPRKPPKPVKKAPPKLQKVQKEIHVPLPTIPLDLQQLLLNIFGDAFSTRLNVDIKPLLQEIKGHLFNREFSAAFGRREFLEAYAARWSPSRALGYLQVFEDLKHELGIFKGGGEDEGCVKSRKVVCLGGGAGAEIVAFAGLMRALKSPGENGGMADEEGKSVEVVNVDMADWGPVVDKLRDGIVTAPVLSAYASAAVKEANTAFLDEKAMDIAFHQHDILSTPFPTISPILENSHLVTLMFTLNELYTTSVSLTQSFLLNLTKCLRPGAMLLVVDSPGSYSTVSLNGAEKKYPVHWLLDFTLLGKGGKEGKEGLKGWEKVLEDESRWFRIQEELKYPIELENMRYQVHLYRRVD
ncbi:hypothetical protein P280DRAFT_485876 [Massarina eburnea CBS 473.64]|uniref:Uncharacterized protein n=1 Tax=Massarina eburnea CBS 473.64 TaxID=1395130 RepID=A0A6A6SFP2_9PLEO|nr:hypothetical protein P280DRAFT_485876 [Massarina eburnea CBS 473.64]